MCRGILLQDVKDVKDVKFMRDNKTSEYTKTIGITQDDLIFIEKIRGKKSRAGKLKEIIKFYKDKNNLCVITPKNGL